MGRWMLAIGLTALLASSIARADVLVLLDGTRLEGQVVSMDDGFIQIEVPLGSSSGKVTVARSDLRSIHLGSGGASDPAGGDPAPVHSATPAPAPPAGAAFAPAAPPAPPTGPTSERPPQHGDPTQGRPADGPGARVMFLLDASGSMTIGERWEQATAEVRRQVQALLPLPDARFALVAFHETTDTRWNDYLRVTESNVTRFERLLDRYDPDLRASTDIAFALATVLKREPLPTRLVVITDGVITRSNERMLEAFAAVEAAAARGVVVDTVAVQDGSYTPPTVEDLGAARAVLERLARAGRGTTTALARGEDAPAAGYRPLDGARPPEAKVMLAMVESNNVIVSKVLRPYPKFRARMWDPMVANSLSVAEYAGISWYEIVVKRDDAIFDRTGRLELVPEGDGQHVRGPIYIQVVGSEDGRHRTTSNEWRGGEGRSLGTLGPHTRTARTRDYVTVQAVPGATIEVHYHRAGELFQANWTLRGSDGQADAD